MYVSVNHPYFSMVLESNQVRYADVTHILSDLRFILGDIKAIEQLFAVP